MDRMSATLNVVSKGELHNKPIIHHMQRLLSWTIRFCCRNVAQLGHTVANTFSSAAVGICLLAELKVK